MCLKGRSDRAPPSGAIANFAISTQAELNCVHSCLFTRFGLDVETRGEQEHFRRLFPKGVEVWSKVTVSNGDKVHAADSAKEDLLDR